MNKKYYILKGRRSGSALLLAVVLTSLLAVIAAMFLLVSRADKIATSSIEQGRELDSAVDSIVAMISQELVLDTPGVAGQEYYDCPGPRDTWLASNQPILYGANDYRWIQISDVNGFLAKRGFASRYVKVDPPGTRKVILEYPVTELDSSGRLKDQLADADGDGIADSKWIEIGGVSTGRGLKFYAAVRIIDNGGMVNVNTALLFDPTLSAQYGDGSTQLQIDLAKLALPGDNIWNLSFARGSGANLTDPAFSNYPQNYIWSMDKPGFNFSPFDISDELDLRNRYCVSSPDYTRLERAWPVRIKDSYNNLYDGSTNCGLDDWQRNVTTAFDPNNLKRDIRHLLTTYNMDRAIDPKGRKMLNLNDPNNLNVSVLQKRIEEAFLAGNPGFINPDETAAQLAVNLIDYVDNDSNVTVLDVNGVDYFGFETPCVYISEIAEIFKRSSDGTTKYKSYAIELYKPYGEDVRPDSNEWQIEFEAGATKKILWRGDSQYHVMLWYDSNDFDSPKLSLPVDPNLSSQVSFNRDSIVFPPGKTIELQRKVKNQSGSEYYVTVDSVLVPDTNSPPGWLSYDGTPRSIERDTNRNKCIRRLWDPNLVSPSLGLFNVYKTTDSIYIQAHPVNKDFTNIGEIGNIFRKTAYYKVDPLNYDTIGYGANKTEKDVRLDLADPNFQGLFNYLTVWPPRAFVKDPNETRIPGRININTAPWYVIARLPWISERQSYDSNGLALAIAAYRDKIFLKNSPDYYKGGAANSRQIETGLTKVREEVGFESIGELANVISTDDKFNIRCYSGDSNDLGVMPDITPDDGAIDDFEMRDVIFSRISNLVTVRSDVFTAYILVRSGIDGPQKRVIAILDRSGVIPDGTGKIKGKVKILALHQVPEAR